MYLNEDGKNQIKCVACRKVRYWYEFPIRRTNERTCFKCLHRREYFKINMLMEEATKNNMPGLRKRLFDTMDGLKSKTVTIGEAKAVCEVAQVIINTAKVEIEYLKAIGAKAGGEFMAIENKP